MYLLLYWNKLGFVFFILFCKLFYQKRVGYERIRCFISRGTWQSVCICVCVHERERQTERHR